MILQTVEKCKFAQMNDKRYYFEDGIIPFPFYHSFVNEINQCKTNKKENIENWILKEKNKLLKMEKKHFLETIGFQLYNPFFIKCQNFKT